MEVRRNWHRFDSSWWALVLPVLSPLETLLLILIVKSLQNWFLFYIRCPASEIYITGPSLNEDKTLKQGHECKPLG